MPNTIQNSYLISREALKKNICTRDILPHNGKLYIPVEVVAEGFEKTPVVDAAPVIHARWDSTSTETSTITVCSNCRSKTSILFADQFQYCPVCGAKMDLKEDL